MGQGTLVRGPESTCVLRPSPGLVVPTLQLSVCQPCSERSWANVQNIFVASHFHLVRYIVTGNKNVNLSLDSLGWIFNLRQFLAVFWRTQYPCALWKVAEMKYVA